MQCRDFKRLLDEQLDARHAASPEVERALESHGSACPACQAEALRYQTLRQAIAAWASPPAAPADFAERFLDHWEHAGSAVEEAAPPWIVKFRPAQVTLAAAAAASLLLAVLLGVRSGWRAWPSRPGGAPPAVARAIDPGAFSDALAAATSATWDLARATSAPAARVGLDVLDATELSETTASLSLSVEPGSASEVFQDVGERVNEGVRPLSGTARNAFGFLLGPALPPPEAPPPSSKGA
jgi:hypothetical protein